MERQHGTIGGLARVGSSVYAVGHDMDPNPRHAPAQMAGVSWSDHDHGAAAGVVTVLVCDDPVSLPGVDQRPPARELAVLHAELPGLDGDVNGRCP
jgi:hypothetical protein